MKNLAIILHFFVGIGALAGGLAGLLDPTAPMGIPLEVLQNGPFTDFFIPSLFLFVVLGLGNVLAGVIALKLKPLAPFASGGMGAVLILWILIQVWVMQDIAVLHVIFFAIGVVQGIAGLVILANKYRGFLKFLISSIGILDFLIKVAASLAIINNQSYLAFFIILLGLPVELTMYLSFKSLLGEDYNLRIFNRKATIFQGYAYYISLAGLLALEPKISLFLLLISSVKNLLLALLIRSKRLTLKQGLEWNLYDKDFRWSQFIFYFVLLVFTPLSFIPVFGAWISGWSGLSVEKGLPIVVTNEIVSNKYCQREKRVNKSHLYYYVEFKTERWLETYQVSQHDYYALEVGDTGELARRGETFIYFKKSKKKD